MIALIGENGKAKYVFLKDFLPLYHNVSVGVLTGHYLTETDFAVSIWSPESTESQSYMYNWADLGLKDDSLVSFEVAADNSIPALKVETPLTLGKNQDTWEVVNIEPETIKGRLVTLKAWNPVTKAVGVDSYTVYINGESILVNIVGITPMKVDSLSVGDLVKVYDILDSDGMY